MAKCRLCIRWQMICSHCFRRLLARARQWHFLIGLGMLFFLGSMVSFSTTTEGDDVDQTGRQVVADVADGRKLWRNLTVEKSMNRSRKTTPAATSLIQQALILPLSTAWDVVQMERLLHEMQEKIKPGGFRIKPHNNTKAAYYSYRDLAAMQTKRHQRLSDVCQRKKLQAEGKQLLPGETAYHEGWYGKKFLYSVMEVYRPQNFFFCPVLKVGSTFFRRLFFALSHELAIASPYDIDIGTALETRREHLLDIAKGSHKLELEMQRFWKILRLQIGDPEHLQTDENFTLKEEERVANFLHDAGKVMFTREPYAKLLSGYVDKLFAPNPYFWKNIGQDIIKHFRVNASEKSLKCGHDVTFTEFIKYVIVNERFNNVSRDTHFVPSYDQCKPCDFHYDIIGKMESFPQDASLVLAQLGHNLSQSTIEEWSRESELDAIVDSVRSPYGWKKSILKCITWQEAHQRIWRKLQIRGIINRIESFPTSKIKKRSFSSSYFIQLIMLSWEQFRTSGLKSNQKKVALSSAYSFISSEDLKLLREYFLLDFDAFGYDSRPAEIFQANRTWNFFDLKI